MSESGSVLTLRTLEIRVNAEATRRLYTEIPLPDLKCCNACATFALAVERGVYPKELLEFLRAAGIDPARPAEAWGAPDASYLGAWWPFVPGIGGSRRLIPHEGVELVPGLIVDVTDNYPRPDAAIQLGDVPALAVNWVSDELVAMEREAWPQQRAEE